MKSRSPVRGRSVALAALAASLLAVGATRTATADGGGFAAEPAALAAPVAKAAMNSDRRTAVAPAGSPPQVVAAIAAANRITRKPYKWGGGHGRWRDSGYDCSGAVSYVLHAARLLGRARDSGGLMSYRASGKGAWITVYANRGMRT